MKTIILKLPTPEICEEFCDSLNDELGLMFAKINDFQYASDGIMIMRARRMVGIMYSELQYSSEYINEVVSRLQKEVLRFMVKL